MLLIVKVTTTHSDITRLSRDTARGTQPLYSSGLHCANVSSRLIAAVTTPYANETLILSILYHILLILHTVYLSSSILAHGYRQLPHTTEAQLYTSKLQRKPEFT